MVLPSSLTLPVVSGPPGMVATICESDLTENVMTTLVPAGPVSGARAW
jgi:hypothetical protein